MRLIPSLAVLLALLAPTAFADEPYQVEMILVRQNLEQPFQSQPAPKTGPRAQERLQPQTSARPA